MTVVVRDMAETDSQWMNASGLPDSEVEGGVRQIARQLSSWVEHTRSRGRNTLFDRQAYISPDNPYDLMRVSRRAVANDDVVSGVCDVTEGLIFQGLKWESSEPDEADVFNQINRDLNLDEFARTWHREEFTYSQVVVGTWWTSREYKVRGRSKEGVKRKKTTTVFAPVAMSFLDPMRVVPLAPGPFGEDRLAWHATKSEYAFYLAGLEGTGPIDKVMSEFLAGPVNLPNGAEKDYIASLGMDPLRLLWLNPERVFRYCRTKATYERFPDCRLKAIFPLLDLKQQLIEADRVNLVGAANYILLVRKGSKEDPATQEEISNLKEGFTVMAKLPVIVGDHRLQIDIITPEQQWVLDGDKYDALDRRIINRTLGALSVSSSGQRNESTLTVARGVARLLESQRLMMKRALEKHVARAVVDHPANADVFKVEPNLAFTPRNVQLDADSQIVQAVANIRNTGDMSRESFLEWFGFDQEIEAQRKENEKEVGFDDIFQTQVPFSAAAGGAVGPNGSPAPPGVTGPTGGRPAGGGASKKSPKATLKPRTGTGNPSTKK